MITVRFRENVVLLVQFYAFSRFRVRLREVESPGIWDNVGVNLEKGS